METVSVKNTLIISKNTMRLEELSSDVGYRITTNIHAVSNGKGFTKITNLNYFFPLVIKVLGFDPSYKVDFKQSFNNPKLDKATMTVSFETVDLTSFRTTKDMLLKIHNNRTVCEDNCIDTSDFVKASKDLRILLNELEFANSKWAGAYTQLADYYGGEAEAELVMSLMFEMVNPSSSKSWYFDSANFTTATNTTAEVVADFMYMAKLSFYSIKLKSGGTDSIDNHEAHYFNIFNATAGYKGVMVELSNLLELRLEAKPTAIAVLTAWKYILVSAKDLFNQVEKKSPLDDLDF